MNTNLNKKVSIVIPVYNAEDTLKKCIESIMCQTYEDWEVWLIDDGSTDSSSVICDFYSKSDLRIHVVHKKNEGVSVARNIGIEKAVGPYLMFVDSDDFLEVNALEMMLLELDKNDADIVICGFFYDLEKSEEGGPNCIKEYYAGGNEGFVSHIFQEAFGKELLNPPWNKVIKKSLIEQNGLHFISKYSICEDMIFTMEILKKSKKIVFLDVPLYHYVYKTGGNLVNKYHENFYEALSLYYKMVNCYLREYDAPEELYSYINTFFINKTLSYFKKIYSYDGYNREEKYCKLKEICENLRGRKILGDYRTSGIKKKVVKSCIKNKWFYLLHFLYLLT